eukprot:13882601-Ditylum_brightwellii.AAC.1
MGPPHKPLFMTTLSTTLETNFFSKNNIVIPKDATVKNKKDIVTFINTGVASNKKTATTYAAMDLLTQLQEECKIDILNPTTSSLVPKQYNEVGREILTLPILEQQQQLQQNQQDVSVHVTKQNVRTIMHNLQQVMLFQQRLTHDSIIKSKDKWSGGANFIATLHTTFEPGALPTVPSNAIFVDSNGSAAENNGEVEGYVQLTNSGAARTKKDAITLASIDFLAQLTQECHVNLYNPPDIKAKKEEGFQRGIRDAQMILEMLGVRYPKFETKQVPKQKQQQFVTQ